MSSEIEGHITRKYDIKKRLGKGVSLNTVSSMSELKNDHSSCKIISTGKMGMRLDGCTKSKVQMLMQTSIH